MWALEPQKRDPRGMPFGRSLLPAGLVLLKWVSRHGALRLHTP